MKCYKQHCTHPAYGAETVMVEEKKIELDEPELVTSYGDGKEVLRHHRIERYGQCIVCGCVYEI
jgi:hypothetical protein